MSQNSGLWLFVGLVSAFVIAFSGGRFYQGAWRGLKHGRFNMDTLVALGTGSAWVYSIGVALFPESVPSLSRHAYFEAASFIIALISLGNLLESVPSPKANPLWVKLCQQKTSVALSY